MEPQNDKNIELLHSQLLEDKYAIPSDLKAFKETFANTENAKMLFEQLTADKYAIPDNFDSFVSTFGLKKKDISDYIFPPSKDTSETSSVAAPSTPKVEATVTKFDEATDKKYQEFLNKSVTPKNPFIQAAESTKPNIVTRETMPEIPTLRTYLNDKGITPKDIGLAEDINLDRQTTEAERESFDALLKNKGLDKQAKPSYFWGAGKAEHGVVSDVLKDMDDAVKMIATLPGLAEGPLGIGVRGLGLTEKRTPKGLLTHTGVFRTTADWVDRRAEGIPELPHNELGKLIGGVIGLEPLFLEMALTPEVKLGTVMGKSVTASRFLNQMVAKGFTNAYANQLNQIGEPQSKAVIEGLKGAGIGGAQALAFTTLGYGAGKLGKAVTEATKSNVAGALTNITGNSTGFAGFTMAEQVLSGQPIDKDKIRESAILGGALALHPFMEFALGRAMGNYLTASPKAKEAANELNMTPSEARDKAEEIRAKAKEEPDPQKQGAMEMGANTLDGLMDIKVVSEEVKKDPAPILEAIEESDLPKEQKEIIKENIAQDVAEQPIKEEKPLTEEETAPVAKVAENAPEEVKTPEVTEVKPPEVKKGEPIVPVKEETPAEVKTETTKTVEKKLDRQSAIKSDKIFKEQKNQMMDDLIAAEDILLGQNKEKTRKMEEELRKNGMSEDQIDNAIKQEYQHTLDNVPPDILSQLEKLGVRVKDGLLVVDIYKDGTMEVGDIRTALRTIDKGFPARVKAVSTPSGPGKLGKSQYSEKARQYGSMEEAARRVKLAEENLATANKSGNKGLSRVMGEQLAEAKAIHEAAKGIDFERIAKENRMDADKPFNDLWKKNSDQFNFNNVGRERLFDILDKEGRPKELTYDTVQPLVLKSRLEKEGKTVKEKIAESNTKLHDLNLELSEKFSRKDGKGLKQPKTNSERWHLTSLQNQIRHTELDIADLKKYEPEINKLLTNEKPNEPSTPTGKEGENKLPGGTEATTEPVKTEGETKPITAENTKVEEAKALPKVGEEVMVEFQGKKHKDTVLHVYPDGRIDIDHFGRKTLTPDRYEKIQEKMPEYGIIYKNKNYQSVDEVQDALDRGEITFEEQKPLLEKVRKFEDNLRTEAKKTAEGLKSRIDKGAGDMEAQIKKELDDENSKLSVKLFPNLWGKFGAIQWKLLSPVRDKLANLIASQLKKGVVSQTNSIRWSTKVLTNLYNGLLRTQADVHGTGAKGEIGKLEMMGTVRSYAPHKARTLLDAWRDIVHSDPTSLERVWAALDPTLATKAKEMPLTYGDLSLAEKNMYFALKEWMTWGHEITYANGLIPTKTYLKFKDVTGSSNYIARMYDIYESGIMADPAIQEFVRRGTGATKMAADIYKARKELHGIIELNGHEYDSLDALKEAKDNGEITKEQYDDNKDKIKSDEWRREHAIKDPAYLVAKRVMQTIQNVAIKQYMDAVINNHPEYVRSIKKGEEIPKGFVKLGSSYSWGPFRNKVVASHIVEDFTGFFYQNRIVNTAYDAIKMFDRTKLNQFYKKYRTVYNPFVQTGNVTGNVFFASINGINPFSFIKGMVDSRNIDTKNPALYERLLKSGLIGPVAMTGELKPMDLLNPKEGTLGKMDEIATKAYVGADNLAKIAAYQAYRKQGLTHEQAVRRAYDAFQNYATVGKTWDLTSKVPLVGPTFVKFQADLQRILLNNMLTTPLTTIGTLMIVKMLGNLSSALSGETEEEQKIRENRKGVPTIPFVNIPLSFKVGKSEVNVARYLSPLYLYNRGDSEMELSELSKFMPFQFEEREPGKIFPKMAYADATWGWVGSVLSDKDFRGASISDPTRSYFTHPDTPTDVKLYNILKYVSRSQIPFYKGATDIYNAATGQLDYYGRKRTWEQSILNNIIKIQQFDKPELKSYIEHNLNYLTSKYATLASNMGDAQSVFFRALKNAEDKGLEGDALTKAYDAATKLRDKSIANSLKYQIPIFSEIERLTNVYKKWHPEDKFLKENFQNIEAGKNQVFNIQNEVYLQKNHKDIYVLLRRNDMLKKPDIPKYHKDTHEPLTNQEKKDYSNTYWTEYIRQLDVRNVLTQDEINTMKERIVGKERADTPTGIRETTKLQSIVNDAASHARNMAEHEFRRKK